MKGLFFKDSRKIGFEIMSDVMCVRNREGYDEILVVTKRISDNFIDLINVTEITTVENSAARIGY